MLELANKNKNIEPKDNITFTHDQENAVTNLIEFINKNFDSSNYINGLVGAGGTGKTFIINYIIKHCKYTDSVIKCTSSTHKACRVFSQSLNGRKVETIQSTFGLRLDLKLEDFNPNNPQFNPSAQPKLTNIKLLLIDEASMLPAKLVTYINKTCKELQIKVIYIGDDKQLSPVKEKISIAFKTCSKVFVLNEIVRQGENNPILYLLDLLRYDIENKTYKFIDYVSKNIGVSNYNNNDEGFSILSPAAFKNYVDICFNDEEYTKNIDMYRIVAYTNDRVASWNNYIRNAIITDSDKSIITKNDLIMSYETIVNEFNEIILNNSEEYIIKDIVSFKESSHGIDGFLIKFQLVHGGAITKPIFVVNHRDVYSIKMYDKIITDLLNDAKSATSGNRVKRWKAFYDFKKKYLLAANIIKGGKIAYSRDLDYGFAITSHKSQGSTYDTVFVDLNDMIYDKNSRIYTDTDDLLRRIYVACSRARKNLIICYGR